ncbi:hypothetical protein ACFPTO_17035 [Paraburkholderia denitrificans]|uniref:Uncharacterized protein n=1 Tax=Paraburkholderia denitrificans TaxID=694025 RepID=A0ABW0JBV8_9BURK
MAFVKIDAGAEALLHRITTLDYAMPDARKVVKIVGTVTQGQGN